MCVCVLVLDDEYDDDMCEEEVELVYEQVNMGYDVIILDLVITIYESLYQCHHFNYCNNMNMN